MKLRKRDRTDYIVVHCAATPPSMDIGAKEIDQWHRQRGWLCIGYHYVIRRDGRIETGRADDEIGAHVLGHNDDSVGICLVGGEDAKGKPEQNFTDAQYRALHELLILMIQKYPGAELKGHRDFDKGKACPSFNVQSWWNSQP